MTLDTMNARFRVIEGQWKIGSAREQDDYLSELTSMRVELAGISGSQADSAVWLGRTVDRLSRNIVVALARR